MTARHLLALAASIFPSLSIIQAENLNWSSRKIQLTVQRENPGVPVPSGISIRKGTDEMAVVGDDHLVRIKQRTTGKLLRLLVTHSGWIKIALYHPNGKTLYTAGDDHSIFVWNADNEHDYSRFATEDRAIEGMAIDPNGEYLATVGFNNKLNLYNIGDRKLVRSLSCPCYDMRAIQFSPDGELLAVAGRNGVVRVIRVSDGTLVCDLKVHQKRIRDLVFQDNQTLLTCSDDKTVKLTILGSKQSTTLFKENAKFYSLAYLGSNRLAAGASDNKIHIIDIGTKTEAGVLKGHTGTVCELVADGEELISGSFDTEIRVWQMENSFVSTPEANAPKSSAPLGAASNRAPQFQTPEFGLESARPPVRVAQNTKPTATGFQVPVVEPSVVDSKPNQNKKVAPAAGSSFAIPSGNPQFKTAPEIKNDAVNFSNSGFQIAK